MYSVRWYDVDPTLSLAVSLLRNVGKEKQIEAANFIIELSCQKNVSISKNFLSIFAKFDRRWYDNDRTVSKAFEYLKNATDKQKKEIAVELINYLYKVEQTLENRGAS